MKTNTLKVMGERWRKECGSLITSLNIPTNPKNSSLWTCCSCNTINVPKESATVGPCFSGTCSKAPYGIQSYTDVLGQGNLSYWLGHSDRTSWKRRKAGTPEPRLWGTASSAGGTGIIASSLCTFVSSIMRQGSLQ